MVELFVNLHDERHFSSCWSQISCAIQLHESLWLQIPLGDSCETRTATSGSPLDLNYSDSKNESMFRLDSFHASYFENKWEKPK